MPRTRSVKRSDDQDMSEWGAPAQNEEIEVAEDIEPEKIVERLINDAIHTAFQDLAQVRAEEPHAAFQDLAQKDSRDEAGRSPKLSPMEERIFLHLSNAFHIIASRWSDPPYLILLGTVAGGAFGIHMAALTIGFLQAFILNGWRRLLARCVIEVTFVLQSALVMGTWRCAALHHLGDTVYTVSESGIITPSSAASLTLSTIGMLMPGWQCTTLVVFHSCFSLYKFRAR